jgi:hypothetical protein
MTTVSSSINLELTVKENHTCKIIVGRRECYIYLTLYKNGEILIESETEITKVKYQCHKTPSEIIELTKASQFEMNSEDFYNLCIQALKGLNDHLRFNYLTDELNSINTLTLEMSFPNLLSTNRIFNLELMNARKKKAEKVSKSLFQFEKEIENIKTENRTFKKKMDKKVTEFNETKKELEDLHLKINQNQENISQLVSKKIELSDLESLSDKIEIMIRDHKQLFNDMILTQKSLSEKVIQLEKEYQEELEQIMNRYINPRMEYLVTEYEKMRNDLFNLSFCRFNDTDVIYNFSQKIDEMELEYNSNQKKNICQAFKNYNQIEQTNAHIDDIYEILRHIVNKINKE